MQAKIWFHAITVDSQEFKTDNAHMFSEVILSYEAGDKRYPQVRSIVKQTVGAPLEAALEVSKPNEIDGPFNYEAFRAAVETYFRRSVGPESKTFGIGGKGSTLRNVLVLMPGEATIEVSESSDRW